MQGPPNNHSGRDSWRQPTETLLDKSHDDWLGPPPPVLFPAVVAGHQEQALKIPPIHQEIEPHCRPARFLLVLPAHQHKPAPPWMLNDEVRERDANE